MSTYCVPSSIGTCVTEVTEIHMVLVLMELKFYILVGEMNLKKKKNR